MIYLETQHLILRDYGSDDFDAYFHLKSHEKTMYYLQDIKLHSLQQAKEDFQEVLDDMEKDQRCFYFFHIEDKQSHQQIGSIGYTVTDICPEGKFVHAGFFIYPEFWGRNYTTEAFRRVLEFAFEENDVYRVSTGCLSENYGSEKVMIKCGLIKEAEHVDFQWHDGKLKNRLEYRMLKGEWKKMQK